MKKSHGLKFLMGLLFVSAFEWLSNYRYKKFLAKIIETYGSED